MATGFKSTFKGPDRRRGIYPAGRIQLDFSAELSKVRAAKPDAMYVFYPGGPGMQFMTQYAQSGLKGQVPLYSELHHRRSVAAAAEGSRGRQPERVCCG